MSLGGLLKVIILGFDLGSVLYAKQTDIMWYKLQKHFFTRVVFHL